MDSAAGQCIVEEAGGRVTDTDFTRLRYNTRDSLLNRTSWFFPTRRSAGENRFERTGNNVKTLIIALTCLAAVLGGVLFGDYHGLWKRDEINRLEIIPIRFKAIDYHVRCRSQESSDLCLPVAGAAEPPGVKTVRIAGQRKFETGLLFNHDKGLVLNGPRIDSNMGCSPKLPNPATGIQLCGTGITRQRYEGTHPDPEGNAGEPLNGACAVPP